MTLNEGKLLDAEVVNEVGQVIAQEEQQSSDPRGRDVTRFRVNSTHGVHQRVDDWGHVRPLVNFIEIKKQFHFSLI